MKAGLVSQKTTNKFTKIAKGFSILKTNKNYVRSKKRWAQGASNVRQNHG